MNNIMTNIADFFVKPSVPTNSASISKCLKLFSALV